MNSSEMLGSRARIAARLVPLVAALGLLVGSVVSANAQRANGVPGIPIIVVTPPPPPGPSPPVVTPAPGAAIVVAPPAAGVAPAAAVTSHIVGVQPDASAVVPNTHVMQQQSRGGGLDDNFLTEDWGKGRNQYGARIGSVRVDPRKRIDTPPQSSYGANTVAPAVITPARSREVLIVLDGNPTDTQVDALIQRHRLARIESQVLPLLAATVYRWRIPDNRSVDRVVDDLLNDRDIRFAQQKRF